MSASAQSSPVVPGAYDARFVRFFAWYVRRMFASKFHAFRVATGTRIFGCDDCLAACPWNKFAEAAQEGRLKARAALQSSRLADLLALDNAGFRALFARSPVKRIGRDRFVRNVLYAAGNSADASLVSPVQALTVDPDPVVADAARWALGRLTA